MEVTVSTRPIAMIDLKRTSRFPTYFGELPYLGELQGDSSTDLPFIERSDASLHGLFPYGSTPRLGTVGNIQCETELSEEDGGDKPSDAVFRVAFEDIESFRRTVAPSQWSPSGGSQSAMQALVLTNWLQFVAENESSRPILNIEEIGRFAGRTIEREKQAPVTVSPALRREAPATRVGGLGHVSAGLLLWLESSDADAEDV